MARPTSPSCLVASTTLVALMLLSGCGRDVSYVAPPPPKVTDVVPVKQPVMRYVEATGNAAAVNTTNLVARVSGFLQEIDYKDGDQVKQGATLFTIEPEPYKLKLEQAQAAEAGAQAALKQTEAEYERQIELASRQVATKAALDNATANRRRRHGAPRFDRRAGGGQRPDPARHHRRDRSHLRHLQHRRAGCAAHSRGDQAPWHHQGGPQEGSDRSRAADRRRIPVPGHA